MTALNWWLAAPDPRLSQGDVVELLGISAPVHPRTALKKKTVAGGAIAWGEVDDASAADGDGMLHMLSKGRITFGLVVTHSCQLDKKESTGRVLVCPVATADRLGGQRENVFAQRRISLLPLPNVPGVGDCYADLRAIQGLDRRAIEARKKLGSLAPEAVRLLQLHIAAFFSKDANDEMARAAEPA